MADFPPSDQLIGKKIAGYAVAALLNAEETCHWYDVHSDSHEKAILYVYRTREERDAYCPRVHGFRTSVDQLMGSTEDSRLFANLGDHRLMMPIRLRELLTDERTRPSAVPGYTIERVLGAGFKGVTYEARRERGPSTPYALKLTIAEEYEGKTFLPEVDRMVEVARRDRDHFPQIHECGSYEFTAGEHSFSLVYFVEDFIAGSTLENVLSSSPGSLDVTFLYHFIQEMLAAIATMQACNLMHDDLHAGNVILHEPLAGRRRPYLIDFGSAKPRGTTKKPRDDIRNLASQIAAIANAVQQSGAARTAHEERILTSCESLLAVISDDDPMRRPEDASELLAQFDRSFAHGSVHQELTYPFDFGNAEEVMDNNLLYNLAAKSFPWQEQIEASSHLLVIGPRGCGKTTVFRSMSFVCLADAAQLETALEKPYVGLYVSCNKEFRQRFSAIDRARLLSRQDEIRHYFHLVVLREMASALVALSRSRPLLAADVRALATFVHEHCPRVLPSATLADEIDLEARVTRAVHDARMGLWAGTPMQGSTTQGFLADLAEFMATRLGPFAGKTLYLFVDDYTEGKVPREAQQALNHILFVPNAAYKCKISSEVFGVIQDDVFQNFLDQDREYKEWNLGTLYCIKLPAKEQKRFLKEIVDKRLSLCGYDGTVDSVISDSHYSEGTFERSLKQELSLRKQWRQESAGAPAEVIEKRVARDLADSKTTAYYHGWDTICNLCTGDVSNILELLNRMFKECGVKKDRTTVIPPDHQDAVIGAYSRQYISKVKGIPRHGERLFAIVDAFGNMSKRLLEDYPLVTHGDGREEPYRLLRIELDEAFSNSLDGPAADDERDDALQLWKLLQRYCIFIDADEGRSRRHTLSSRVIMRRIFCPAFRIGLVNSESFTVSQAEWQAFCSDPAGRADQYVRTCVQRAVKRRGEAPDRQQKFSFPSEDKK